MNMIDITDMSANELDTLLDSHGKTFRCPGCGGTVDKFEGYESGMCCSDCVSPDFPDWFDDSWGDHNPNYDY